MAFEPQEDWPNYKSYKSLNPEIKEIRVLDLLPGDGPIKLTMVHMNLLNYAQEIDRKVQAQEDLDDASFSNEDASGENEDGDSDGEEDEDEKDANEEAYTALSYCWGPRAELRPIFIGDEEVQLRRTVWEFLNSVRLQNKEHSTRIWLDIICINQRDVDEKNSQVSMMGDIYSYAKKTILWLGEGSPLTDLTFDFLHYYHSFWCRQLDDDWLEVLAGVTRLKKQYWKYEDTKGLPCWVELSMVYSRRNTIDLKIKMTLSIKRDFDEDSVAFVYSGIEEVFSRPYWKRVWVIQEMLLSKDCYLLCGNREISARLFVPFYEDRDRIWRDLATIPDREEALHKAMVPVLMIFRSRDDARTLSRDGSDLASLLETFEHAQCSEPRDKIYGLRALLAPSQAEHTPVDYEVPLLKLWMQSAVAMQKEYLLSGFNDATKGTSALRYLWDVWGLSSSCKSSDDLTILQAVEKPMPFMKATLAGVVVSRQSLMMGNNTGTIFELSQQIVGGKETKSSHKERHVVCCSLDIILEGDICCFGFDTDEDTAHNDQYEERTKNNIVFDYYHLVIIRWQNERFVFVGTAKCYSVPMTLTTRSPSSQHEAVRDYIWTSLHEFTTLGKPDFEITPSRYKLESHDAPWDQIKLEIDKSLEGLWYSDQWVPGLDFAPNFSAFIYMTIRIRPSTEPALGCFYLNQIRLTLPSAEQGTWRRIVSKHDAGIEKVRDLYDEAGDLLGTAKALRRIVNLKTIKAMTGLAGPDDL